MPDPMWKQIAEDLRQKIEAGEIGSAGQPLPTELELQAEYSASRNTVRDAIKWLVTRGMVNTRSGQGTFVAQKIEIQRAAGLPADELRLPGDASVVSRHQQRFIDGLPYSLQTTFYPMRLVELGATQLIQADDIVNGAVSYIRDAIGVAETGWRQRIVVRIPGSIEAAFFGLPDDGRIAVFEFITTGYDKTGQPIRVTVTTYPTDRNQFVMTSGKVPAELPGSPGDTDRKPEEV